MDEDAGRRACAARRTPRSCGRPRRCATARRRPWSRPATPAPTMASALLRMGRIKGVSRPAIATAIPVPGSSTPTVLLDAGANAECQPEWLVQFAQMGSVFARHRFGIDASRRSACCRSARRTRKGNTLVKETYALLRGAPGHRLHRQRRGSRHPDRRRRRRRHRRLHRQRRAQDARGGAARRSSRRCSRRSTSHRVQAGRRFALMPALLAAVRAPRPRDATAAPCCSGSTACASSATARRARRPCSTPSRWPQEMVDDDVVGRAAGGRHGRPESRARPLTSRHSHPDPRRTHVPAETHVEQGPLDRDAIFEIVRDRLADILEIDPADDQRGPVVRRRPRRRLAGAHRARRGARGGARRAHRRASASRTRTSRI